MITKVTNKKLKELLVEPGYISEADFELAQKEAEEKNKYIAYQRRRRRAGSHHFGCRKLHGLSIH